ncbi:acyl-CoA dehydrogenase [Sphingobacterium mizutaii NBRC 14946 = DSM 11724]|uniref:Acyl-CoA dehydrogenase, short-chain specific n=2 Tax=Sphingobacterium mizutaii TaxID=1010 RepID=A0AAJ4XE07_9SPHI|nr:acyl-CoA dehydrogenase family protein [Sphingobacterium mizutaii]GEM70203.1 acyl-CoA dehydrogenase [Sphingobacterium mizutaii NBRC 14946 = DSM 11724]SDL91469.1 glutaryl-CoA dehydrogenase [Sphingobacterium mizutaii]SNV58548.1 Acyl-CoA dehydrogenase, short-chain specific [Sphingobacterium mizutaii]
MDYYQIEELLSPEQLLVRDAIREFVKSEIVPVIDQYAQEHKEIPGLMKKLGAIGALGPFIPEEYGGVGLDYMSYGLIMQELEFGDSAIRSAASVQSSLVMFPIYKFGSEEQKHRFLPRLASGDLIGAFGLTEPNHGSDPASMETKLVKDGDGYRLSGSKMWITNAPICDIAVVWARDEDKKIRGVIVERGFEGFSTPETLNKWSLRASKTGELVFDQVFIPQENVLPEVSSMKGPLSCLNSARYGISWGAIGAAVDCYETALKYAKERKQFGKPIASFQLQQKKLAEMVTEISKAQLLSWRLGQLKNEDRATPAQISMAKRNNVNMALQVAREARQILGAMGIVGDYPIMRHMMNLESVITYEGTHDVHLLITGNDITGINAF